MVTQWMWMKIADDIHHGEADLMMIMKLIAENDEEDE